MGAGMDASRVRSAYWDTPRGRRSATRRGGHLQDSETAASARSLSFAMGSPADAGTAPAAWRSTVRRPSRSDSCASSRASECAGRRATGASRPPSGGVRGAAGAEHPDGDDGPPGTGSCASCCRTRRRVPRGVLPRDLRSDCDSARSRRRAAHARGDALRPPTVGAISRSEGSSAARLGRRRARRARAATLGAAQRARWRGRRARRRSTRACAMSRARSRSSSRSSPRPSAPRSARRTGGTEARLAEVEDERNALRLKLTVEAETRRHRGGVGEDARAAQGAGGGAGGRAAAAAERKLAAQLHRKEREGRSRRSRRPSAARTARPRRRRQPAASRGERRRWRSGRAPPLEGSRRGSRNSCVSGARWGSRSSRWAAAGAEPAGGSRALAEAQQAQQRATPRRRRQGGTPRVRSELQSTERS